MYREFTNDTLPPELKECIGLINAFDWDKLHKENQPTGPLSQYHKDEPHETVLLRKQTYYPEVCDSIGWRVRDRYALIVPYDYFIKLKGEPKPQS